MLLIAECLDDCQLRSLYRDILDLGMTPLVELHDEENLQRVLDLGATLVGVNNRDLKTMTTDLEHALPSIWGRRVVTIFMGGGTPSLFSAAAIDRLLESHPLAAVVGLAARALGLQQVQLVRRTRMVLRSGHFQPQQRT